MENANAFSLRVMTKWNAGVEEELETPAGVAIRVGLAFALALAGGSVSFLFAASHERLCRLISFAAGTLLGVTLFSILPETYESMPIWKLSVAVASGYLGFLLISHYVFHVCPACAASHFDEATTHRFSEIATAMVIALAIHSTLDGLALALGKESELAGNVDASLVVAICVHKVPEGLALCALLLASGLSRIVALGWVAAVESTTLLGGVIGIWIGPRIPSIWLDMILAHVGGGFIFLAIHAVFGELVKHSRSLVLVSFAAGLLLIALLNFSVRF
jgi:ZIP family zinc transporter